MADIVGQQIGNYQIIQSLGQGGFAEVYLGEHVFLKTKAAIKLLHTNLNNQEDVDGFLVEARTIAHLHHPHIVRVLDFGLNDKTPFLVMDYAPNGTLRQRHSKGTRIPLAQVVTYIQQVSEALQYAHDEKLIHRDIKPENMLLGQRQEVLLSDFGIALIAQSSRYQSTQDVVGTVAYMAPEQIQGKPRPASDQYSLGIVAYEWLGGVRPFSGSFTELCAQHMYAPPDPLRSKVPDLPPAVENVVMTALAKDLKQRFGRIQDFALALSHASHPYIQQGIYASTDIRGFAPQNLPLPQQASNVGVASSDGKGADGDIVVQGDRWGANRQAMTPPPPPVIYANPVEQKNNPWGLNKRQMIAALIGTVIFTILYYAIVGPLFLGTPFLDWLILFNIVFVVPSFLGVVYGPWVGVVSCVVGSLVGDAATHNLQPVLTYPINAITAGFIPGLAYVFVRGQYRNFKSVLIALLMSVVGVIAGIVLFLLLLRTLSLTFSDGIAYAVGQVFFFLVMLIYWAIVRTKTPPLYANGPSL